jgi:FkbM family methyltransferase
VATSLLSKLRPAKVRNAVRRRWFEHQLARTPLSAQADLADLGTPYGGWTVPTGELDSSWTCYSVGAGADISFDLELIRRFGMTVRSVDAVAEYAQLALERSQGAPKFSAHHAAIAPADGPMRMQVTHDPQSQSVSAAGLYESDRYVEVPGRTLPSLMAELGDERIDLLKLDIEGVEYDLLPDLDLAALGVRIFAFQIHHTRSVREGRALIAGLRAQGYEPVACRAMLKFTLRAVAR